MQTESNEEPWPKLPSPVAHGGVAGRAIAAAAGRVGWTVRCTPQRRTVYVPASDGVMAIFVKLRSGRHRGRATHERAMLRELRSAGFPVPEVMTAAPDRVGEQTVVVMGAVPGRPVRSLLAEAQAQEDLPGRDRVLQEFMTSCAAPRLARLHAEGFVYRDMYWNHWLAPALDAPHAQIAWIDVERVFKPRTRVMRWVVKDLAGLWSSRPGDQAASRREVWLGVRFLRTYLSVRRSLGCPVPLGWRELAARVAGKAARIRAHRPLHP